MCAFLSTPLNISPQKLAQYNRATPRYTSYPTAPEWKELDESTYKKHLHQLSVNENPLSLYVHIPFCKTMCLYCGCAVVLNRKPENETLYVEYLEKEIALCAKEIGEKKRVSQLHFGGGTPTKLSNPLFYQVYRCLQNHFSIEGEVALEIDPRTVVEDRGKKLRFYKELGINRVSFGVQDTDPKVQEAVKRRQSYEMTKQTFLWARELGFEGINIDLIYGLPHQTEETFQDTIEKIAALRPDRLSLFSYAKVPWLKPHQRAIKEALLPSVEQKFSIYAHARKKLIQKGYIPIGMDHFALQEDSMAKAYHKGALMRNFQGYSVERAENMLGFGMTAIGFVEGCYAQNAKTLTQYYQSIDTNHLPVVKGCVLSSDDQIRKWVIHTLMCRFMIDKNEFLARFGTPFDTYFEAISHDPEFVEEDEQRLKVTPLGELFVRLVAQKFDAYTKQSSQPLFSQSI